MKMKEMDVSFTSKRDEIDIFARRWESVQQDPAEARAIVQIVHGMGEHSERYKEFAEKLVEAGYIVYAHDHRGHGKTVTSDKWRGKFSDRDGWNCVFGDVVHFTQNIKQQHPNLPLILFGHSMGSFLTRRSMQLHGRLYDAVMVSGTGGNPSLLGQAGLLMAKLERLVRGKDKEGYWMNRIIFGGYNRAFHPTENPFSWLSRDQDEVAKYILDPDCGQVFKTTFYCDLITGVAELHRKQEEDKLGQLPKDFPILVFSGARDPVGNFSRGVREVYDTYKRFGFTDVTCTLYEDGRHEMLHETNREDVFADIIRWLNVRFG